MVSMVFKFGIAVELYKREGFSIRRQLDCLFNDLFWLTA